MKDLRIKINDIIIDDHYSFQTLLPCLNKLFISIFLSFLFWIHHFTFLFLIVVFNLQGMYKESRECSDGISDIIR